MAKLYRRTARIKIKIEDITVTISPLTQDEKAEIQTEMLGYAKGNIKAGARGVFLCLKYAVKDVSGIEDSDGNPYALKFEDKTLSDESVNDLLNMELTEKLTQVCSSLTNGIPKDFNIEGVEVVRGSNPEKNA